ncbi:ATP-dependent zinc protease family protein [Lacimicrobium alkaliphilum]|uniref:Ribosomal protein S6 modification protein n=1 Tax=Lacimicrobium alkaliphilum TaxID=1526571 RepID=A0ABQ1RCK5_9ALTE|nr:ATP-dependent zinc protease [Lacimicrobium alkaliphilum]GGD62655.1 ribosomal protein S6 modification protein [Lacimicrobium alkaliphilum]
MQTLGWREWGALPALGIDKIKMKVDTGAKTSCLHAFRLESFEKDGKPWVRIYLHPHQNDNQTEQICESPVLEQRCVRDSGGHEELRYVIETDLHVADQRFKVELTLTNRDSMRFRMLLGRQAMEGRFVVDPQQSYVSGQID